MTALGPDSKCEAQVPIIYADLVNKGGGLGGGSLVNYLIWAPASFVTVGRPCLPPRRTSPALTYVRLAYLAPLTTSYLAG